MEFLDKSGVFQQTVRESPGFGRVVLSGQHLNRGVVTRSRKKSDPDSIKDGGRDIDPVIPGLCVLQMMPKIGESRKG